MGPRGSSSIYPSNLLDLVRATAWAPPNLPLFPGLAPAPTGAPVEVSAPAAGASPWLRPLHEIQQAALSLNPSDRASSGDTAASPWTADWSATPRIPAAAPPYADRDASNPYHGSAADAGELDPARTRRLLAEAKRASDFAAWISDGPTIRSAQPMGYVAGATDAPRPSAPSAGSDDQFDGAVGTQPPQNQLGPASNGLFVQSSGWPFPPASMDAALPPMVVAANDQAPAGPWWEPVSPATPRPSYSVPLADFAPYSPENQQRGTATYRVIQEALDALGIYLRRTGSAIGGNDDYNRCMRAANGSAGEWGAFCDSMLFGLRGNVAGNDSAWRECRAKDYESKQIKENWCRNQFGGH
jgi:hypothetical protein